MNQGDEIATVLVGNLLHMYVADNVFEAYVKLVNVQS